MKEKERPYDWDGTSCKAGENEKEVEEEKERSTVQEKERESGACAAGDVSLEMVASTRLDIGMKMTRTWREGRLDPERGVVRRKHRPTGY